MEFILDNRDEDRERLARRRERAERMRREKQRQMKRRRMMKKILRMGVRVFGIIVIMIIAFAVFKREPEAKETQMPVGTEAQSGVVQVAKILAEGISQAQINMTEREEGTSQAQSNMAEREEEISQIETGVVERDESSIYSFESTSDTVTIYSEEVISSNAILIDESTDTIVASKGAKERISPASMTKVLTVLVAAEHITEEELDDTFTMTVDITDYGYINDCSSVGFLVDEKVTVRDLFYGTILPSGSDAAVGLATYVAGSHEAFVDLMNKKLEELGLSDSAHFTNCVGLYDENHYCTVYDMAVIMKAALQNELCREVLSAHNYTTAPTAEHPEGINISNWFLRRIEDKDTGGEVLCAKTGYVVQSKNCAVSYGTFTDGRPYICVTAGATSSWRCIYDHVEIYNQYVQT